MIITKVLLTKTIESLGSVGEVVDVADGYARNYLIPRGIAFPADDGNMRALAEEKKQAERRSTKELKSSEKLGEELEKISITLKMKVGEDEKLFGAGLVAKYADVFFELEGLLLDKADEFPSRVVNIELPAEKAENLPANEIGRF